MFNLQATLREITVLDLPLYLDMSDFEVEVEADTTTDFPDLSPAQLGLHLDNSILHA